MFSKGVSDIVSNVLIILLVLVATGMIWLGVRAFVNQTSDIGERVDCTVLQLQPVSCTYNDTSQSIAVNVLRGSGSTGLSNINFIFSVGSNKIVAEKISDLRELETKRYVFDYVYAGISNGVGSSLAGVNVAGKSGSSICNPSSEPIQCVGGDVQGGQKCTPGETCTDINGDEGQWTCNGDDYDQCVPNGQTCEEKYPWFNPDILPSSTCDYRFSIQQDYTGLDDMDRFGISNNATVISGGQFHLALCTDANKGTMRDCDDKIKKVGEEYTSCNAYYEEMFGCSVPQIKSKLFKHLKGPTYAKRLTDPNQIFLIDVETGLHPKDWNKYLLYDQQGNPYFTEEGIRRVQAYSNRTQATRELFNEKGWTAQLSAYGIIVAPHNGKLYDPTQDKLREAYLLAGQMGAYDGLDYLTPVLYIFHSYAEIEEDDPDWNKLFKDRAKGSVQFTATIKDSNGNTFGIAPVITASIQEQAEDNNLHKGVDPKKGIEIIKGLQESGVVDIIIYWAGSDSYIYDYDDGNGNKKNYHYYFWEQVRPKPLTCVC